MHHTRQRVVSVFLFFCNQTLFSAFVSVPTSFCIAIGSWFSIIHLVFSFFFSYIAWKKADLSLISIFLTASFGVLTKKERKKKSVFRIKGGISEHGCHGSVYLVLIPIINYHTPASYQKLIRLPTLSVWQLTCSSDSLVAIEESKQLQYLATPVRIWYTHTRM